MMVNYIVSTYKKAWISEYKELFIAEPYVYYSLKSNHELDLYSSIKIARPLCSDSSELEKFGDLIFEKYNKYIPILASRLNKIHNQKNDDLYWKKCLSLSIVRHITFLFQTFKVCEENFDPIKHTCKVLDKQSYCIPQNYNHQRDLLQNTAFGQEQLFSAYIHMFYPGLFQTYDSKFNWNWTNVNFDEPKFSKLLGVTPRRIMRKGLFLVRNIFNWFFKKKSTPAIEVAVINSYYSQDNFNFLDIASDGKISKVDLIKIGDLKNEINYEKRKDLTVFDQEMDDFDKFFFGTLDSFMPQEFVESFSFIEASYETYFQKFSKVKYVVSEAWIGDTYTSIALAILQRNGVKHIYNEHNYLGHQFLGANHRYLFGLVDKFLTLGWFDSSNSKCIKGGSLFSWHLPIKKEKVYDLGFVAGGAAVKLPEFNAAYGYAGAANADRYINFFGKMFSTLSVRTLEKMVFKDYPNDKMPIARVDHPMYYYDIHNNDFAEYLKICFRSNESASEIISKSRLVVVNYLSTSYLQSLIANVPTIFIWDPYCYPLNSEYSNFYDGLINVGICQTDPINAAYFIDLVIDDPESWWERSDVVEARKLFLNQNIGGPNVHIEYLLKLV